MAVSYDAVDIPFPKLKRRLTTKWIRFMIEKFQKRVGDISYVFCSDEEILRINNQYLKHDYYTDIITFDYSENNRVSGDLFISLDTVKSNSEKFDTLFDEELYRVMIHGVLHLCGLNDKTEEEQIAMRKSENEALDFLNNSQMATSEKLIQNNSFSLPPAFP